MFYKALFLIVVGTLTASALLTLRQQRYETMHQMTQLHQQIATNRRDLWDMQTRIAGQLKPDVLTEAVKRAQLQLESVTPAGPDWTDSQTANASPLDHHGQP